MRAQTGKQRDVGEDLLHDLRVQGSCKISSCPTDLEFQTASNGYVLHLHLSASRTVGDRHNGHSAWPFLCIFTRHRTQNKCWHDRRIGLKAIEVQMRQA